ncbi:hypothetical protein [Oceanidesulfovibrio marinus]|uniref:Uncharacterized protein n=1 Tax=Oceanidesulfovibrio marinus TaxID=370038 RepID=A0A6P1ZDG9_9BACT|nr:hypothetical protein [Oceanidesulfovibrio marinus]QJT10356.1 hypothetical protein E8L03_16090 [Oceanidesulfovibrio marinus]TVM32305.1 hypothetical protein DQK91_15605 [Oceanidesulfovibrio marinus]
MWNSKLVSRIREFCAGHRRSEHRCHLTGWWLFVGSAIFFIIAGLRSGDVLTIVGGILFLLGCLLFLYPMACLCERAEETRRDAGESRDTQRPEERVCPRCGERI